MKRSRSIPSLREERSGVDRTEAPAAVIIAGCDDVMRAYDGFAGRT
jgi:hypothetical protein